MGPAPKHVGSRGVYRAGGLQRHKSLAKCRIPCRKATPLPSKGDPSTIESDTTCCDEVFGSSFARPSRRARPRSREACTLRPELWAPRGCDEVRDQGLHPRGEALCSDVGDSLPTADTACATQAPPRRTPRTTIRTVDLSEPTTRGGLRQVSFSLRAECFGRHSRNGSEPTVT